MYMNDDQAPRGQSTWLDDRNSLVVEERDEPTTTEETTAPAATTTAATTSPPTTSPLTTYSTTSQTSTTATNLPNLNISNGTCYVSPGRPMDKGFIPCGNAAAKVQTCCWQGDICLETAYGCMSTKSGNNQAYLAGCTNSQWDWWDNEQVKRACPERTAEYTEEPWVCLAYCGNGSAPDARQGQWVVVTQQGSPTTMLSTGPSCVCPTETEQRMVAFTAGPSLSSYASLPLSLEGTVSWIAPYTPSYIPPTSSATPTRTSSLNWPEFTPAPDNNVPASNHDLILGLGIGGFFGVLSISFTLYYLKLRQNKRMDKLRQNIRQQRINNSDWGVDSHLFRGPLPGEDSASAPPPPYRA